MRKTDEWIKQSDYDFETAEYMFKGGRYFYSVFMCHLSIEKMLKGIYFNKFKLMPPKSHNLVFLVEKIEYILNDEFSEFISELNLASVATRYPEDLIRISNEFTKARTAIIITKTKEFLKWLKKESMK